MKANESASRTGIVLFAVLLAGLVTGILLWPQISLPFSNPLNIVGPLTVRQYNPLNNIVRFGLVLLLPSLLLLVAVVVYRPLRRAPEREEQEESVRPPGRRQGLYRIALVVSAVLFVIGTANNNTLDTFHEGETLGMAVCYEHGMVPYRDFLFVHGLYQDPLRAVLAFDLFGRSISSVRMLDTIHRIVFTGMLVGLLLYLYRGNARNALLALLFLFFAILGLEIAFRLDSDSSYSIFSPSFPSRDMTTLALILLFVMLYRMGKSGTAGNGRILLTSFVFSLIPGLAFAYSIDRGFYLTAAWCAAVVLLAVAMFRQAGRRSFLAGAAAGMAAGILVLVAVLGEGTAAFVRFVFLDMPRYKELFDGYIYPVAKPAFVLPVLIFSVLLFRLTLKGVRTLSGRRTGAAIQEFLRDNGIGIFLFLLALLFFRSALGRAEWGHLGYSLPPLLLLLSWLGLTRGVPYLEKRFPRSRPVFSAAALAGAVLFWLGSGAQIISDGLLAHVFPAGRPDTAYLPDGYSAAAVQMNRYLPPDATLATLTSEAVWYYLLDRPCPVRFPVVWFAAPVMYQRRMIDELDQGQVMYLLYRNDHWANKMDGIDNATRLPVLMAYIDSHYSYDTTIAGQELWKRRE